MPSKPEPSTSAAPVAPELPDMSAALAAWRELNGGRPLRNAWGTIRQAEMAFADRQIISVDAWCLDAVNGEPMCCLIRITRAAGWRVTATYEVIGIAPIS